MMMLCIVPAPIGKSSCINSGSEITKMLSIYQKVFENFFGGRNQLITTISSSRCAICPRHPLASLSAVDPDCGPIPVPGMLRSINRGNRRKISPSRDETSRERESSARMPVIPGNIDDVSFAGLQGASGTHRRACCEGSVDPPPGCFPSLFLRSAHGSEISSGALLRRYRIARRW